MRKKKCGPGKVNAFIIVRVGVFHVHVHIQIYIGWFWLIYNTCIEAYTRSIGSLSKVAVPSR